MAATIQPVASFQAAAGGRSGAYGASYLSYNTNSAIASPVGSQNKLNLFTSARSLRSDDFRGASPTPSKQSRLRATLRNLDTKSSNNMNSYTTTATLPSAASTRSDSRLRLHKRNSSSASVPASGSPLTQSRSATPYGDPFPDVSDVTPTTSTPKIKPYLRKISVGKEDVDQGRIDLSKSITENEQLAGLGIHDFGANTTSEMPFSQSGRRTPHARTISGGSQISVSSASFRPTQPFVHPMRLTPNRPYTPPPDASLMNAEEAHESSDIVTDDDLQLGQGFRNRSMSLSSFPQLQQPTPLSQSHTAADLGYVPKITNTSQTNLSIKSSRSVKSSKSRLGRSRTNTNRSVEFLPTPSSRTSFDKAFSLASRRSETEPQSRDERIKAARRKFEAKEASKDRKAEQEALKRRETESAKSDKMQERQRRQSEASERTKVFKTNSKLGGSRKERKDAEKTSTETSSRSFESSHLTALPTARAARTPEKSAMKGQTKSRSSSWLRSLSCGLKRR